MFLTFAFIFLRAPNATSFFACDGPIVPSAIYSEPRFHESFVVSSRQSILGVSVRENSRFATLNRWTRNVVSSE